MKIRNLMISVLSLIAFLFSCEKDELPKPISNGDGTVLQVLEMGASYANQIGFSLENASVNQINAMDWDMYIYPDKAIRLNTSRFMKVLKVESENDFTLEYADTLFTYDTYSSSHFNFKLNAINNVSYYILDLGRNLEGEFLYKLHLKISLIDNRVFMEFKKENEDDWKVKVIELTSNYGHFYSFIKDVEMINPIFIDSDFYCGGYITKFDEANLDYLVRGILVNKTNDIEIDTVTTISFEDISLADIPSFEFRSQIDQIGYDWKFYDLDKGLYMIDQSKIYIIKYSNGLIYKLKFIDYYNEEGKKGFPTLSFSLLE